MWHTWERRVTCTGILWENAKEISFWEDLAIDVQIILQYTKEIGCDWT